MVVWDVRGAHARVLALPGGSGGCPVVSSAIRSGIGSFTAGAVDLQVVCGAGGFLRVETNCTTAVDTLNAMLRAYDAGNPGFTLLRHACCFACTQSLYSVGKFVICTVAFHKVANNVISFYGVAQPL